ncbi:MAG: hypothetical protein HYS80_02725, partial [Candidatus Aenigmarchaeota archaeon]|nr:hypothetical protein [Candidatus Aenigmarchaeota archaeon]
VIDAKRALCIGPTTYRFDGRFDLNGPLFITFKNNVACPAETECDANLDDVLVFEKDGNMPNVCTALNATDMAILEVIPIQVIPDVDMVKDKSGYVVIVVENRGNVTGNASVNATFAGSPLVPLNGIYSANISPKKNASINFTFKPGTAGNNLEIIANVSVS